MINWVAFSSILIVLMITIKLIHYYSAKNTKKYVHFSVFLGYFLAFALVGLIPYDLYLAISSEPSSKEPGQQILRVL